MEVDTLAENRTGMDSNAARWTACPLDLANGLVTGSSLASGSAFTLELLDYHRDTLLEPPAVGTLDFRPPRNWKEFPYAHHLIAL